MFKSITRMYILTQKSCVLHVNGNLSCAHGNCSMFLGKVVTECYSLFEVYVKSQVH